jgi:hypothetical protein
MRSDDQDRATEFLQHVYTGWGSITIIVPRGVGVQIVKHRGGVSSRLQAPVPGFPLIRLDVTTMIGKVRLRHPESTDHARRSRRARAVRA